MSRKRTGRTFLKRGPRTRGIWMETRRLAQIKINISDAITKSQYEKKHLPESKVKRSPRRTSVAAPEGLTENGVMSAAGVTFVTSTRPKFTLVAQALAAPSCSPRVGHCCCEKLAHKNFFARTLLCCWPAAVARDGRLAVRKCYAGRVLVEWAAEAAAERRDDVAAETAESQLTAESSALWRPAGRWVGAGWVRLSRLHCTRSRPCCVANLNTCFCHILYIFTI